MIFECSLMYNIFINLENRAEVYHLFDLNFQDHKETHFDHIL